MVFRLAVLPAVLLVLVAVLPNGPVHAATDSDHDGLTNAFERNRSHTSRHRADSNGNGLLDPAEDPDGDGLGNLGEQRFGTDPLTSDTDGDAVPDNLEDADNNGIGNGAEQDRRPIPPGLRPSLGTAHDDLPISYAQGCHDNPLDAAIHPCVFGDRTGRTTIALFGDSHAEQWLGGLIRAAGSHGWKIITIGKSACPSVHVRFVERNVPADAAFCRKWRLRGEAWIRNHVPDITIISNSSGYQLLDAGGQRVPKADREAVWQRGLERTLADLPARTRAVVLSDPPRPVIDVPDCLKTHRSDISACEASRARVTHQAHVDAENAAAVAEGAKFVNLGAIVCPYDPCPVIVGHLLLWRDQHHLTQVYSRQLAPSLAAALAIVIPDSQR